MEAPVDKILTECVNFMMLICEQPKNAYPISSLPYPKKWMKTILLGYVTSFKENRLDGSLSRALELRAIKNLCLVLPQFIDDTDAELVKKIEDIQFNDSSMDEAHRVTWFRKFILTEDYIRYEEIKNKIWEEKKKMENEINVLVPMLASINLLDTK